MPLLQNSPARTVLRRPEPSTPQRINQLTDPAQRISSQSIRRPSAPHLWSGDARPFFADKPDQGEPAGDLSSAPVGVTLGGSGGLTPEMGLKF